MQVYHPSEEIYYKCKQDNAFNVTCKKCYNSDLSLNYCLKKSSFEEVKDGMKNNYLIIINTGNSCYKCNRIISNLINKEYKAKYRQNSYCSYARVFLTNIAYIKQHGCFKIQSNYYANAPCQYFKKVIDESNKSEDLIISLDDLINDIMLKSIVKINYLKADEMSYLEARIADRSFYLDYQFNYCYVVKKCVITKPALKK
jgi:hypothetical protein